MKTQIVIEIETANPKNFQSEDPNENPAQWYAEEAEAELHEFFFSAIQNALDEDDLDKEYEEQSGMHDYFGVVEGVNWDQYADLKVTMHRVEAGNAKPALTLHEKKVN